MAKALRQYVFLLLFGLIGETICVAVSVGNNTEIKSSNVTKKVVYIRHRCSYKHLRYCHRYIKSSFYLYTNSGGWILLAIVLCGIFFQALSHLMAIKKKKEVAFGIVQATNFQLKLNFSQRLGYEEQNRTKK